MTTTIKQEREELLAGDQRLPAKSVAAHLGINVKTLIRWAREGIVPGYQLPGGDWRFRAQDVAECMKKWRNK